MSSQHCRGGCSRQGRRAAPWAGADEDADGRPEQLEPQFALGDHDALVTTVEGEVADWGSDWGAARICALLEPEPSPGSRPCAICTASPPLIAAAAASDPAISLRLVRRVEGRFLA
jgi:hypothetical protein